MSNFDPVILDAGHKYLLKSLDGEYPQKLQFVKRCDLENPARFPGNTDSYPGATLQSVIRILIDRVNYLQNQINCIENSLINFCLKLCLWLLEFRAARRHGKFYFKSLKFASESIMCNKCGHTFCNHE